MHTKNYLVAAPIGDQTFVIVFYLKKYLSKVKIQKAYSLNNYVFLKNYSLKKDTNEVSAVYIPTSASDTMYFLQKGDIVLGNAILKKASLLVYDKNWMLKKATEVNIPIPTTWHSPPKEVQLYPIFYKQKQEVGGGVRGIAYSLSEIPKKSMENLIFQEYISSKGTYGVSFIAENGKITCSHIHYELESLPKTGGSAVLIEECEEQKIYEYTEKILKHIKYSGWGLAEYKFCHKRNDYVFMEINAKFWASCELAFINQPEFLKVLFGITSTEKKIKRILFIERALSRLMLWTIIKHLFSKDTKIRLYPQWYKSIIINLTPRKIRFLAKKLIMK